MANRNWKRGACFLDREVVKLYGKVTFGVASITATDCLGFAFARTGVGLFTITLDDRYPLSVPNAAGVQTTPLLGLDANLQAAAASTGTLRPIVDNSAAAAKTITCSWDVASASADPATGAIILLEITLRNTSAPRRGA